MDHPITEVGVDMDERKEWHKTPYMVENVGEDKTIVDMCLYSRDDPCLILTSPPHIILIPAHDQVGGFVVLKKYFLFL